MTLRRPRKRTPIACFFISGRKQDALANKLLKINVAQGTLSSARNSLQKYAQHLGDAMSRGRVCSSSSIQRGKMCDVFFDAANDGRKQHFHLDEFRNAFSVR